MKKRMISLLLSLVLTVGLLAVPGAAAQAPDSPWMGCSNEFTGTTTYTAESGKTYTVYIYPEGTTFWALPMDSMISLSAWDTREVGDQYFNQDYVYISTRDEGDFAPEPGVIYDVWVSNSIDG